MVRLSSMKSRFKTVMAELKRRCSGYGQSSKPRGSDSHTEYSKRTMAGDMAGLMTSLGYERFSILAHDRGARVAHRLALDHVGRVEKMVLLDIAPTLWMYEHTDMAFVRPYPSLTLTYPLRPREHAVC